jgi:hypothetical protein
MPPRKKPGVIKAPVKAKAAKADGADDLAVLHPNQGVTIAGRKIVMREYGFIEGLRLMPMLDPIIADIRAVLERREPMTGSEQLPPWLATHADALVHLVSVAADVDPEWVTSLTLSDGHELLWWWWMTNGPFCMRSASQRVVVGRATATTLALRAGQTSTAPSSPPATDLPKT